MPVDVDELKPLERNDFRRANGAPQVVIDGKNERFSRPSGWGKELDDENALVFWKLDRAIIGVAKDPALQARAAAVKEGDEGRKDRAVLRDAAIAAGRGAQAADIGTALHAMSERWEKEPDFDPGPVYVPSLQAYEDGLRKLGLVSEMFEYHVVNREYRAAGTADRLYRLTRPLVAPDGSILPEDTLIVGDLKTGKSLDFSLPGYMIQLAIYAQGEFYDVVEDMFRPTPDINHNWGILAHMPSTGDRVGECEFLWADLEVGNYGAWLVSEVRAWRKRWKSGEYRSTEISSGVAVDDAQSTGSDTPEEQSEPDSGFDDVLSWIRSRIAVIGANGESRKFLLRKWPDDIPPPNKISSWPEIDAVIPVLDETEAQFEIPFGDSDPRLVATRGKKS